MEIHEMNVVTAYLLEVETAGALSRRDGLSIRSRPENNWNDKLDAKSVKYGISDLGRQIAHPKVSSIVCQHKFNINNSVETI
jgi:hypothetical protein